MKKGIRIIAACLCLSVFAFMAMASDSSSTDETKSIVKDEEVKNETQTEKLEKSEPEETTEKSQEITIEEQELLSIDEITITAKGFDHDSIWGDGIKLLLENKSERNIMVGCTALIVNDYMITDLFASDVAAGMKANETIHLSSSELKACGIDTIGKIEVYFHIFDSDTYDNIYDSECVEIHTSAFDSMSAPDNSEGVELYNADGIKIVGKTVDENSFWGSAILLYIENTSDKNVGIGVDDMSINGFMMTPYFSSVVYSGKKSMDDITILSSELEENEITSIDEITLAFRIYDPDSFLTTTKTEAITFSAK